MITEEYVSDETFKLLKEKRFDDSCCRFVVESDETYHRGAPTLQMAMKWLREVHNIHIIAEPCLGEGNEPNLSFNRWFWTILKEEGEYKPIRKIDEFTTYEQACEAAINFCLEKLI
jgi:hypothetical protein